MKVKYLRLDKKNKKNARKKYYDTKEGIKLKKQFKNISICSYLCILAGILIIVDGIFNTKAIWDYIYGSIVIIFGLIFLLIIRRIKIKKINDYVIKNKL